MKHTLLVAIGMLVSLAGCSRPATVERAPGPVVSPQVELPKVTESVEQIKAELKKHEPFSPPFEAERLKLLVLWDEIRKREGVEGFQTPPLQPSKDQGGCIDPATGQIAWRAMTCYNPDCPGRGKGGGPLLFVRPNKTMSIGPEGKIVISGEQDIAEPDKCVCPACGSGGFVAAYDPPESFVRNRQLDDEMRTIARAYHEAEASGQPIGVAGRTPAEVMTEKAELPKLYLAPEPGQVTVLGQFIVPASRGLGSK